MQQTEKDAEAAAAAAGGGEACPAETASEQRRRTGQYGALSLVLVAALIGLYHAFLQQNAVLAGFLVPGVIMVLYLLWVLHSAARARAKQLSRIAAVTAAASAASAPGHGHGNGHGRQPHGHPAGLTIPKVVIQEPSPVREVDPVKVV